MSIPHPLRGAEDHGGGVHGARSGGRVGVRRVDLEGGRPESAAAPSQVPPQNFQDGEECTLLSCAIYSLI